MNVTRIPGEGYRYAQGRLYLGVHRGPLLTVVAAPGYETTIVDFDLPYPVITIIVRRRTTEGAEIEWKPWRANGRWRHARPLPYLESQ
jgi:hypothetical protein